jgi:hypothetical protein
MVEVRAVTFSQHEGGEGIGDGDLHNRFGARNRDFYNNLNMLLMLPVFPKPNQQPPKGGPE